MSGMELLAAAAAVSAAGTLSQAASANSMARHSAAVSESYATAARDRAAYDEERSRENARRMLGAQRARYGGAGVVLEGTPIDVMADAVTDAELDALSIRGKGALESRRYLNDAAGARYRGGAALRSGAFEAGSSLLTGASKLAKK